MVRRDAGSWRVCAADWWRGHHATCCGSSRSRTRPRVHTGSESGPLIGSFWPSDRADIGVELEGIPLEEETGQYQADH